MRTNLPVTQVEFEFPADTTLLSTTDINSHITYANAAFVAASGFDHGELIGQPHNLVRHPDMPAQAFADMWATLKRGHSWTALVKNRRKNGDHYWVRANATPVMRGGRVVGYMSVRTKPSRQEVAATELLYKAFREGRAGARRFHEGLLVRTGLLGWTSALKTMPVAWRIRCAVLVALAGMTGTAGLCGLAGSGLTLFGAGAGLMALAASAWLEQQIAAPLQAVQRQALSVAAGLPGDLRQLDRVDEIGMILRAINQAGLNLRSVIDDVGEQVDGVRTAGGEIALGNNDLSQRTEQAASDLAQTVSAMEQMVASVANNSDTARQATSLSSATCDAASRGGEVVAQVVNMMQAIATDSSKISDIVGVIDGFAFQTNILALNAAVEASRAGEHGRGFAVVASEVRLLAQRSAQAAKEIKALIDQSVKQISAGSTLVSDAGKSMAGIVEQVRRVTDLISEISVATAEQSTGLSQVNVAVSGLDRVTQQNAALVEQSAAAATSLKQKADRLVEAVKVFASVA